MTESNPVELRLKCVRDGHPMGFSFMPVKGKKPFLKGWQKQACETLDQAEEWARRGNIAIRTGEISGGLVVIDEDRCKGGSVESLNLPETVTVATGGGGFHYYFCSTHNVGNSAGKLSRGVDVRGNGGCVVAPGSVHPDTGEAYEFVPGKSLSEVSIATLPDSIAKQLQSRAPSTRRGVSRMAPHDILESGVLEVQNAIKGHRNSTLYQVTLRLGRLVREGRLDEQTVRKRLKSAAPLSSAETEATISSALRRSARANADRHSVLRTDDSNHNQTPPDSGRPNQVTCEDRFTDVFNCKRFADDHRHEARFDIARDMWRIWDGRRWNLDTLKQVVQMAKKTLSKNRSEAEGIKIMDARNRLLREATNNESLPRIEAMLELAKPEPGMSVPQESWDADPFHFNVENGTVDLRNGQLRAHNADDLITRIAPVSYMPSADCPQFDRFLDRVLGPDASLIAYVQALLGMCLTGDIREQILPIFLGTGANGKSTLLDTITHIMGDYASPAPPDLLTVRNNEEHPAEVASLVASRLVVASETERGKPLRIQLVKQLTGDSQIRTRFMRQNYSTYNRTFKIILVTNNLPQIREDSESVWRRLRVVPFSTVIPPRDRDTRLLDTLRSESSGILNWLIRGCLKWQSHGLPAAAAIDDASLRYRSGQGVAERFVRDACLLRQDRWESSKAILTAFDAWCERFKVLRPSKADLWNAMAGLRCTTKKRDQQRGWQGLQLCCGNGESASEKTTPDTEDTQDTIS
jgi:putative DNA primase/helicase